MRSRSFSTRTLVRTTLSVGLLLGLSSSGEAQNGFFPFYVTSQGLTGGAGTAFPLDAGITIANPAGLTRLKTHAILTAGWLHRELDFNSAGAALGNSIGKQRSHFKEIPIGSGAFNIRLNEKWAWGIMITGGGSFVKYSRPSRNPAFLNPPGQYDTQATNRILLSAATVSYRPWKTHSYGISLLVGYSNFKSDLANGLGIETRGLNRPDSAFGFGTRIGGIWDLNKMLTVGASVATPVYFTSHRKYTDVFVHKMQIPATIRLGTTWHLTPKTDFVLDLKEIFYGECKWLTDSLGWKNQTIILTGFHHKFTERFMVGVGYNYGRMQIRKNKVFINALAALIDQHIFSAGFRYKITKKTEFIAFGFYVPKSRITDDGTVISPAQGAYLESRALGIEAGLKVTFG